MEIEELIDGVVGKTAMLAKEAAGLKVATLAAPTNALDAGLPKEIPVLFDPRTEGRGVIDAREYFEKYRLFPARRKGTATINTLDSFIDLVNRHKTEQSVIFAETSWPNPKLTAVLDYHEKVEGNADAKPQFGEHRVVYPFPLTDEFKAWAEKDGKVMSQGEFAAFVEDRIAELSVPDGAETTEFEGLFKTKFATPAEMIELSRGLEVNVAGKMKNSTRLSSGESEMIFVEEHLDTTGAKITVPGLFMVNVPAFLDGEYVRIPARLRYRAKEGVVSWFFHLYRWKEILRERVVDDVFDAKERTGLPAYEGKPEA